MATSFGGKLNGETMTVLKFFDENGLINRSRLKKFIEAEEGKIDRNVEALKKQNALLSERLAAVERERNTLLSKLMDAVKTKPATRVVQVRTLSDTERAILAVIATKTTMARSQVTLRLGDAGIGAAAWAVARRTLLASGLIEQVDKRRRFATYRATVAGRALLK